MPSRERPNTGPCPDLIYARIGQWFNPYKNLAELKPDYSIRDLPSFHSLAYYLEGIGRGDIMHVPVTKVILMDRPELLDAHYIDLQDGELVLTIIDQASINPLGIPIYEIINEIFRFDPKLTKQPDLLFFVRTEGIEIDGPNANADVTTLDPALFYDFYKGDAEQSHPLVTHITQPFLLSRLSFKFEKNEATDEMSEPSEADLVAV